jgi:hypothetical protein
LLLELSQIWFSSNTIMTVARRKSNLLFRF